NTAVATVNTSGTVTAKANGVAEIYATNTASGEVGICIVTVGTGKSTPAIATEEPNLEDIYVYPNPTDGKIQVTSYELQVTSIEIYDVMGRLVTTPSFGHTNTTTPSFGHPSRGGELVGDRFTSFGGAGVVLDLSHLPTGIYFIRIHTESGIVTRRVVKQ
ncbi:MAG: T9SS type A sorting domain-containing protein, partial [Bacteroidales bacterium]|nr:T9SS type A sorting domain-containing protein [Bacteroidales bacterium]